MPPRIELKQTNKRVIYLGKTYNVTRTGQFQTFAQIAKHLKVSKALLTEYISNDTTRSIVKPNGEKDISPAFGYSIQLLLLVSLGTSTPSHK